MRFTIAHSAEDNGAMSCYGNFATRKAAEKVCERMERSVDDDRDPAYGGVGLFEVCRIRALREWDGES